MSEMETHALQWQKEIENCGYGMKTVKNSPESKEKRVILVIYACMVLMYLFSNSAKNLAQGNFSYD